MNSKQIAYIVFAVLIGVGIWLLVTFFPLLPDTVATQFDTAGEPVFSLPKAAMGGLHVLIMLFCAGYVLGFGALIQRLPDRYFKFLRHREYWLSGEHKEQTRNTLASYLLWLGNATLAMFIGSFYFIYKSNTAEVLTSTSKSSNLLTTAYLAFIFFGLLAYNKRFKLPEELSKYKRQKAKEQKERLEKLIEEEKKDDD